MSQIQLQLNKDYVLHIKVAKTLWSRSRCITFKSQWLNAKDSDSLQTRYQVHLTKDQIRKLINLLREEL